MLLAAASIAKTRPELGRYCLSSRLFLLSKVPSWQISKAGLSTHVIWYWFRPAMEVERWPCYAFFLPMACLLINPWGAAADYEAAAVAPSKARTTAPCTLSLRPSFRGGERDPEKRGRNQTGWSNPPSTRTTRAAWGGAFFLTRLAARGTAPHRTQLPIIGHQRKTSNQSRPSFPTIDSIRSNFTGTPLRFFDDASSILPPTRLLPQLHH